MERYQDCIELLDTVEHNIKSISEKYEKAKFDEELKSVLRPLVKSSLEHLRSILEYSAQDIWSSFNSKDRRLYFPYAMKQELFSINVKKNIPNLREKKPFIYSLVESIQPHFCGDNWLIELCDQTNFNKHNKLTPQIRKNSDKSRTNVGRLISMSEGSAVTFNNCSYNGVRLGHGQPAVISSDMTVNEIQKSIGIQVPVTREFEWVEFRFPNSSSDTLSLIKKAHYEIGKYIFKLRNELN